MLYLQWVEGFRIGRGQVPPPASICDTDNNGKLDFTSAEISDSVDSDSTTNIELGGKSTLLDNSLTLNVALYRVDWKDIPVRVFGTSETCFIGLDVNAGEARSDGLELEARYHHTGNLQFSLALSYMETEFLDDEIGESGDRLPLSPQFNGVIGVNYDFILADLDAFIRSDYSYVGGFDSAVEGTLDIIDAESYGKLDMRAGIEVNQWSFEFYGKNITNEDAITSGFNTRVGRRMTPRTIGIDVGYRF